MVTANKVVARFRDGTLKKGHTSDFFPNRNVFHLELEDGKIEQINTEKLKALYFVKDLAGDRSHEEHYTDTVPGGGRKIQVTFTDGEVLIGFSQGYSPNRSGFFVVPGDLHSNNERIFVITSATEDISFL